ncbi:glycerol-3-phosphate 1-O-acyltransferase PlsY [Sedimentisphaera salicampi]|uniref:Glycerol-3-phosphate acyltransferase n=1 Tax=Sedimentisphaera salicampi TaxID=1941349 RepID=A0A1W6LPQ7_9BACT|nr:glycerol-3-phosphate 1-O-acyltransferase PlsY [Sedimentisphaera salicampi]ARN57785.1 G3P acyltransferase [Sedimentisphaera salicampi]OXU13949.1 G3P acyltransferase [Sedimentisphaera salicampi]
MATAILLTLPIFSYLLGSVPFGFLIAKSRGIDLRTVGSGNIGATNLGRALGGKWAKICFLLDLLKGALPMIAAGLVVSGEPEQSELWLWLLCGAAAIAGHIFPIYLKFKGGKGVATGLGVVLGLWPYYTICGIICFIIWIICLYTWKYVSLGSIIGAAMFPVILSLEIAIVESWSFSDLWPLIAAAGVLAILVIYRHKKNITKLINGTEQKAL